MILSMPFLSKFKSIIDLGKWTVYLPKLGTSMTINHSLTLFPSSTRCELIQRDIKFTIPKDYQTTLNNLTTKFKAPLDLTTAYIQVPIKVLTFDPITEFPDVFPEKIPNKLPPLRELHMRYWIKLIDPEKIINPQVIPITEKYYSQFREHMTKNLGSGQIYSSSSSQASVMFYAPKPAKLYITHFVTDFQAHNLNIVKD